MHWITKEYMCSADLSVEKPCSISFDESKLLTNVLDLTEDNYLLHQFKLQTTLCKGFTFLCKWKHLRLMLKYWLKEKTKSCDFASFCINNTTISQNSLNFGKYVVITNHNKITYNNNIYPIIYIFITTNGSK